jgi:hypothetical protein
MYMPSTRTQVYLTTEQRRRLDQRSGSRGVPLAQLIREAVDSYLNVPEADLEAALESTFGTMPDLDVPSRDEWDRGYSTG